MQSSSCPVPFRTGGLPPFRRRLALVCGACGNKAYYDVGRIGIERELGGPLEGRLQFGNYFRCATCGGPGPWTIANPFVRLELTARSALRLRGHGIHVGVGRLFDGTAHQSAALAEEHLQRLIREHPDSSFLLTRLGNLRGTYALRGPAIESYRQALDRDPLDLEANYHLFVYASEDGRLPDMLAHAAAILAAFDEGRMDVSDALAEGILSNTLRSLAARRAELLSVLESARKVRARAGWQFLGRFLGPDAPSVEDAVRALRRRRSPAARRPGEPEGTDRSDEDLLLEMLDGVRLPAVRLVPAIPVLAFYLDGKLYRAVDSYCLNPRCDCSQVGLDFVEFPIPSRSNSPRSIVEEPSALFTVNYRSGTWEPEESALPEGMAESLRQAFLGANPQALRIYASRHAFLRKRLWTHFRRAIREVERDRKRAASAGKKEGRPLDLEPSLQALVKAKGLNPNLVTLCVNVGADRKWRLEAWNALMLTDAKETGVWTVPSVRALFRGSAAPPDFESIEKNWLPKYEGFLDVVERHILAAAETTGNLPTDEEVEEVCSAIRRRPDGKTLGLFHDIVRQSVCLAMGLWPFSEEEFSAILLLLERLARRMRTSRTSRNYVNGLRDEFHRENATERPSVRGDSFG